MYTELFLALFNRNYNNAIKLINMGAKVNYPENNFDETPLGLLLHYAVESPEKEKEKINSVLDILIDKNIKFDYEKDSYNNYRVFTYLSQLVSNAKYHENFITFIKKYYTENNILLFSVIKPFINIADYNILNTIKNNNITIDYEQNKVKKDQEQEPTKKQTFMNKYYELLENLNKLKQEKNNLQQSKQEEKEQIDENDPNYLLDQSLIFSIISSPNTPQTKFIAFNALINTGYKLETEKYDELLKETINNNCLEIFKMLLDKGAKINTEIFNLILKKLLPSSGSIFIQKDMFDLVYNLIKSSVQLNDDSIELIILLDDLKLFYLIIDKYNNFNDNNFEKFIKAAIETDNKQIIKELISLGAKLEKESATTYKDSYIYQCIETKNYKLALFLIDNGAKINFNDFNFKDSLLYSVMNSVDLIFYPTIRKINKDAKKDKVVIIPPYDTTDIGTVSSYDLRGDVNIPYCKITPLWNDISNKTLWNDTHNKTININHTPNPFLSKDDENNVSNKDEKVQRKQINNKDLIKLIKLIVEKSDYLSYSFNNIDTFQESPFSIAFRFYSEEVAKHVLYNVIKHHIKIYYNHKYSKHIIDYEIVNFVNKVYDIFNSYISKKEIIDNDINFENIIDDFVVDQKLSNNLKNLLYLEFNNVLSNIDLK